MFGRELLCPLDLLKRETDIEVPESQETLKKSRRFAVGERVLIRQFLKKPDWIEGELLRRRTMILACKKLLRKGSVSPQPHEENEPDRTSNPIADRLERSRRSLGHNARRDTVEFCCSTT
ncbi:hypothetical protein MTO96_006254 [Rhipicephalus appendiculatus]